MRLERRLAAGVALLVIAGGATGGAVAAAGSTAKHALPFSSTRHGLLQASADYLGVDVTALESELKGGRTLAQIARSTPGRSERALVALLVADASREIQQIADRPLSPAQKNALRPWLRRRVAGYLDDTCPLSLVGLEQHFAGCAAARL